MPPTHTQHNLYTTSYDQDTVQPMLGNSVERALEVSSVASVVQSVALQGSLLTKMQGQFKANEEQMAARLDKLTQAVTALVGDSHLEAAKLVLAAASPPAAEPVHAPVVGGMGEAEGAGVSADLSC